ncbi:MAG: molecular chaperone HtpG, partial [Oscillospiraceae bacterium]|nr:molecular chaperone HtpG [Oscillospiraceae bacterium]
DQAFAWSSKGVDGYTIEPCFKNDFGTKITLHIKEDTENENYSDFLEQYTIMSLVKKYSDFIRYPIKMMWETNRIKEGTEDEFEKVLEERTLNSMIPLWKKNKTEIEKEEYTSFYRDQYGDWEEPARVIHTKVEGNATYSALLYIPERVPFDYYSKNFEKGLQLYSSGVMIMERCGDLLPDYFSFVKGLVDSEDLSLNISREMLQHDRQLKLIAKNIERKIRSELLKMQKDDREKYEKFFKSFGAQLKYGIYDEYGANKDNLADLIMFVSSKEKKLTTLAEYCERMKEDQNTIYYACGETADKIDMLPQAELIKDKGFEILYLTENVDEFALQVLASYKDKTFTNISSENLNLDSEEEKDALKELNEKNSSVLDIMKETLAGNVTAVRFTNRLKSHPVCLISEGMLSIEMEKVLSQMPSDTGAKAEVVMEINKDHPIADKLRSLADNREKLEKYTKILYAQARLIEGLTIDNPTELSNMICELML